jgi:hypothetical protein
MRIGEIDVADHVILLPDHHHLLLGLEEIHRGHRIEQEARNVDRPTPLFRREHDDSGQRPLIDLAERLSGPGQQDRIVEIGDAQRRLRPRPPRSGGVEIGMRLVEGDGSRSRRRLEEILTDGTYAVRHARDPAVAAVRAEIGHGGLRR